MKTPLVIFHKQLGDVLLLEPALAKLAASVGGPVTLATRPAFAPLLSLMEHVQPLPPGFFRRAASVISFEARSRACLQAMTTLAAEKRLVVPFQKHLHWWHRFVFPTECRVDDEALLYRAKYFFAAMPGHDDMAFRPPRLKAPPKAWLPAGLPAGYVLVHATSAWQRKSWPAESWAEALTSLHEQGIGPFVLSGGDAPWERNYIETIGRATRAPLINLCGKTDLRGYLAIVANARMVLSIDSSAAHLAAAFQRPSVVLFGPTNPAHWHDPTPYSRLIDAREFVREKRPAVANIPVSAVVKAAAELSPTAGAASRPLTGKECLAMPKRLRILRVVIGLNQGGVQQAVLNLFKGLDPARFEPIACAIENSGAIGREIEQAGFEVITLGYKRQALKTILALRRLMIERQIDIVHASSYHPSFYARIAGILAGVPVLISHEHVVFDHQRRQRAWFNRLLAHRTAAYIAVGQQVGEQIIDWYGYPQDKVKVIHNGVNLELFAPLADPLALRASLGLPAEGLIVVMVARLDPEKGHRTLFEAISLLPDQGVNYLIIGTGRGAAKVHAEAEEFGVSDRVSFLGMRRDIPALLQVADIFAFPTLQEGFSNALIEAMASGCAIAASDYPSNLEAVEDGKSALISPRLDAPALAANLQRLLSDATLRKALADAARERVETVFSVAANAGKTMALYDALWQNRNEGKT